MKDGHLNKCAHCVLLAVKEWRNKNPNCRKEEHAKNRTKKGFLTKEQWKEKVKKTAKGRKRTSLEYAHRRRVKITLVNQNEFDIFVVEEATALRELRNKTTKINWHLDHTIPINHKKASGLHNAFNIQVVPATWNVKKKNLNMDSWINL